MINKQRVLILSMAEEDYTRTVNDDFVKRLNAQDDEVVFEWANYRDLVFEILDGDPKIWRLSNNKDLKRYDLVYFKSFDRYQEQAVAVALYLDNFGVKYSGTELRSFIPKYKLTQMMKLAVEQISIPDTVYVAPTYSQTNYHYLVEKLGRPFIYKDMGGRTGNNNYLVKNKEHFQEIIAEYPEINFIAQRYVKNDGDLRVLVMADEIKLVINRRRNDDSTHLNNTSRGANAENVKLESLSAGISEISLQAARAIGRDVAGVDVMINQSTNMPLVLEVNASPQIGSGALLEEKTKIVLEYCKQKIKS